MGGLGVIVEYLPPSLGKESARDKVSCSGIYLGNGWILTHGTIVTDVLKEKAAGPLCEVLKREGIAINENGSDLRTVIDITESKFQIIYDKTIQRNSSNLLLQALPKRVSAVLKPSVLQNYSHPNWLEDRDLHSPLVSSPETPHYFSRHASVSMLFLQPGVTDSLSAMMPPSDGWRLTEEKDGDEGLDSDLASIILPLFVVLKVNIQKDHEENCSTLISPKELVFLTENLLTHTAVANKGANAYIESSPFGSLSPSVFLNSLSKGIISNVSGHNGDIYLTDARCMMGGEGAPVYTVVNEKVNLCAIVISSFCWKNGEWLGLSILAAARPVLQALHHILKNRINKEDTLRFSEVPGGLSPIQPLRSEIINHSLERIAKTLDNVVVAICCDGGWGSGIVINTSPGIILTCAHVVQHSLLDEVTVITAGGTHMTGQVIYRTNPHGFCQGASRDAGKLGSSMWDIALVQTSATLLEALPLASSLPPKGSSVLVAGHGIFNPYRFPAPSFSHGIISKIICIEASGLELPSSNQWNPIGTGQSKGIVYTENKNIKDIGLDNEREAQDESLHFSSHCTNRDSVNVGMESIDERDTAKLTSLFGGEDNLVPVMFQTTCSVYAGNSGGPIVSYHPEHGLQVVGLMVCNTKDLSNKATFPHINLAVPAPAMYKIISSYILSKDKKLLSHLGVECPAVSKLWALDLIPQSRL
ncbi:peroxisomal leader peptide-processing protease-like [Macrobrachium nipponense]|uniref:peroxisomal leader peptide-processing protease-like n=1 Tax=Macrobrachium nipponense TaxID=159736 RepID=UPI0030C88639